MESTIVWMQSKMQLMSQSECVFILNSGRSTDMHHIHFRHYDFIDSVEDGYDT